MSSNFAANPRYTEMLLEVRYKPSGGSVRYEEYHTTSELQSCQVTMDIGADSQVGLPTLSSNECIFSVVALGSSGRERLQALAIGAQVRPYARACASADASNIYQYDYEPMGVYYISSVVYADDMLSCEVVANDCLYHLGLQQIPLIAAQYNGFVEDFLVTIFENLTTADPDSTSLYEIPAVYILYAQGLGTWTAQWLWLLDTVKHTLEEIQNTFMCFFTTDVWGNIIVNRQLAVNSSVMNDGVSFGDGDSYGANQILSVNQAVYTQPMYNAIKYTYNEVTPPAQPTEVLSESFTMNANVNSKYMVFTLPSYIPYVCMSYIKLVGAAINFSMDMVLGDASEADLNMQHASRGIKLGFQTQSQGGYNRVTAAAWLLSEAPRDYVYPLDNIDASKSAYYQQMAVSGTFCVGNRIFQGESMPMARMLAIWLGRYIGTPSYDGVNEYTPFSITTPGDPRMVLEPGRGVSVESSKYDIPYKKWLVRRVVWRYDGAFYADIHLQWWGGVYG